MAQGRNGRSVFPECDQKIPVDIAPCQVQRDESVELSLMSMNIQCFRGKAFELEILDNLRKLEAICISEHWLRDDEIDQLYVSGFRVASHFARKTIYMVE